MLVAQARVENLTLITGDRRLAAYDVQRFWPEPRKLSPSPAVDAPLTPRAAGALDQIQGVVADMVVPHLLAQQILGHDALVQAFAQQTEEKRSWLASGCDL